jgi:tRNA A37 threonylcarbamoyladenosine dehydratase
MMDFPSPTDADPARRFGGLDRLYGRAAAERMRAAHVAVVGLGGVGSWAAEALARSGVARLTLIDLDHVAESNINRQAQALSDTVGLAKVVAMARRIAQINPACRVHGIEEFVQPGNWPALLPEPVDAVIDACDQIAAKRALAAWALQTGTPCVLCGAAGGKRQPQQVELGDLADVTHDPLLAKLRYQLRKERIAPPAGRRAGLVAVFSREPVRPPDASCATGQTDGSLNCHGYGSSVTVTATFGLIAAGWLQGRIAQGALHSGHDA